MCHRKDTPSAYENDFPKYVGIINVTYVFREVHSQYVVTVPFSFALLLNYSVIFGIDNPVITSVE